MGSVLSDLDLVAIQIDGLHLDDHLLMIGAVGIEVSGQKHPLAFAVYGHMRKGIGEQLYGALDKDAGIVGLGHLTAEASTVTRGFFLSPGWRVDTE